VEFDAGALPSGVYYYRLVAADLDGSGKKLSQMKKMVLIR
jgi:hypothetical protein